MANKRLEELNKIEKSVELSKDDLLLLKHKNNTDSRQVTLEQVQDFLGGKQNFIILSVDPGDLAKDVGETFDETKAAGNKAAGNYLPIENRVNGMLVWVIKSSTNDNDGALLQWKLEKGKTDDYTNYSWQEASLGGNGGMITEASTAEYLTDFPEGKTWYINESTKSMVIRFKLNSLYTGKCSVRIERNGGTVKSSLSVFKGTVELDLMEYIQDGVNEFKIYPRDSFGSEVNIKRGDTIDEETHYLTYRIVSGVISLTTTFNDWLDTNNIGADQDIVVPYVVRNAETTVDTYLKYTVRNVSTNDTVATNSFKVPSSDFGLTKEMTLKKINSTSNLHLAKGQYTLVMEAYSGTGVNLVSTGEVTVNFSVLEANSIAIELITQPKASYYNTERIRLQFRVSSTTSDKEFSVTRILAPKNSSITVSGITKGSLNYIDIKPVEIATAQDYTLKFFVNGNETGKQSNILSNITLHVQKSLTTSVEPIKTNCLFSFDSNSYDMEDTSIWRSTINPEYNFRLFNLNNTTTGFLDDEDDPSKTLLKLSGNSYGVLYKENETFLPMKGISAYNGITLDITFRSRCIGDLRAKVLDLQKGYKFDTDTTSTTKAGIGITSAKIMNNTANKPIQLDYGEDEWINAQFVIVNKVSDNFTRNDIESGYPYTMIAVYINGVMCAATRIDTDDTIENTNKMILNAVEGVSDFTNYGSCEIKHIRMYNKALNTMEILQNFIASCDVAKQSEYLAKNAVQYNEAIQLLTSADTNTLPIFTFIRKNANATSFSELHKITEKSESKVKYVPCKVLYTPPSDSDDSAQTWENVKIMLQGTSSLQYPVKNYRFLVYEDSGFNKEKYIDCPNSNFDWRPEYMFTLKCDYMESSHMNNTGTAIFIDGLYRNIPYIATTTAYNDFLTTSTPGVEDNNFYSKTPAQKYKELPEHQDNDADYRTTIDGFPCIVYINDDVNDNPETRQLVGTFMFNLDKEANNNLGFTIDDGTGVSEFPYCQSFECKANDNSSAGAFHKNDGSVSDDEWYGASFEVRYHPSQIVVGDSVYKKKTPYLKGIQALVEWVDSFAESERDPQSNDPYYTGRKEIYYTDEVLEKFRSEAKNHFDVPYLLDYYIMVLTFGMVDNFGKNMMLNTWGTDKDGNKINVLEGIEVDGKQGYERLIWYPTFYDMDTMLGLDNSGLETVPVDAEQPPFGCEPTSADINNYHYARFRSYNTNSKLWDLVRNAFKDAIKERYYQLRTSPIYTDKNGNKVAYFSEENIFNNYIYNYPSIIGERYYNRNAYTKYLLEGDEQVRRLHGNRIEKVKKWIKDRLSFIDSMLDIPSENTIRFRMTASGTHSILVRTYTPMYVKVNQRSIENSYYYIAPDLKTDDNQYGAYITITVGAQNNEVLLYGASNIMYMDGIKKGGLEVIEVDKATRLNRIDVSGTPITNITFGSNIYLKQLDLSNCSRIGTGDTPQTSLNLKNCINLDNINLANSPFETVVFPEGGTLKSVDVSGTKLSELKFVKCKFLTNKDDAGNECIAKITGATITELYLDECDAIENLDNLPVEYNSIQRITLNNMKGIISIDWSNKKYAQISHLSITNMSNLESINLSGVGLDPSKVTSDSMAVNYNPENPALNRKLDLSSDYVLKELNTSNCNIQGIILPKYKSKDIANQSENISAETILENPFDYLFGYDFEYINTLASTLSYGVVTDESKLEDFDITQLFNLVFIQGKRLYHICPNAVHINCDNWSLYKPRPSSSDKARTNMNDFFRSMSKLQSVKGDFGNSNITTASSLFRACHNLQENCFDTATFNFENVTNLSYCFAEIPNNRWIQNKDSNDPSKIPMMMNVEDTRKVFAKCTDKLKDITYFLYQTSLCCLDFDDTTNNRRYDRGLILDTDTYFKNENGAKLLGIKSLIYFCYLYAGGFKGIIGSFLSLCKDNNGRTDLNVTSYQSFAQSSSYNTISYNDGKSYTVGYSSLCWLSDKLFAYGVGSMSIYDAFNYSTRITSYTNSDKEVYFTTGEKVSGKYERSTRLDEFLHCKSNGVYRDTVTSVDMQRLFRYSGLYLGDESHPGSISHMIDNIDKISWFDNTFEYVHFDYVELPDGFFKDQSTINHIKNSFANSRIKADITGKRYFGTKGSKPTLTDISDLFTGCSSVTGAVGKDFFDAMPGLTDISQMFHGTSVYGYHKDFLQPIKDSIQNVSGMFRQLKITQDSNKNYRTLAWYDDNGRNSDNYTLHVDMFKGCSKLENVSFFAYNYNKAANQDKNFVRNVSSNTGYGPIPTGLFRDCTKLSGVAGFFTGFFFEPNSNGKYLPDDLFLSDNDMTNNDGKNTRISNLQYLFYATNMDETKYSDFSLDRYPNVTNVSFSFSYCDISDLSQMNIFFEGCKITSVRSMFILLHQLKTIPYNIFYVLKDQLTNAAYTFYNNTKLTAIPNGLFGDSDNLFPQLVTIEGCFVKCKSLTTIPDRLIYRNTMTREELLNSNEDIVMNMRYTFAECSSIKEIPGTILDGFNVLDNELSGTYDGTNTYNPLSSTFTMTKYPIFYYCTALTKINSGLLDNIKEILDNNSLIAWFANCTSLTEIPSDLIPSHLRSKITSLKALFYGCTGLRQTFTKDYFNNMINLTDISYMFNNTGQCEICNGLFENDINISKASYLFNASKISYVYQIFTVSPNADLGITESSIFDKIDSVESMFCNVKINGKAFLQDENDDNIYFIHPRFFYHFGTQKMSLYRVFADTSSNYSYNGSINGELVWTVFETKNGKTNTTNGLSINPTSMNSCFRLRKNMTGKLDNKFLAQAENITSMAESFRNCLNMTAFLNFLVKNDGTYLGNTTITSFTSAFYNFGTSTTDFVANSSPTDGTPGMFNYSTVFAGLSTANKQSCFGPTGSKIAQVAINIGKIPSSSPWIS